MRHKLRTHIDIPANVEDVWRHLIDVEAYPTWNPFITRVEGVVAIGSKLAVTMEPPGGSRMIFRPRVTALEPTSVLEWLGRLVVPGVFDGRHRFELHTTRSGTRLIHSESFRGFLVPFLRRTLDERTRAGFIAMNHALAERVTGR